MLARVGWDDEREGMETRKACNERGADTWMNTHQKGREMRACRHVHEHTRFRSAVGAHALSPEVVRA
eukprot:2316723-Pleurochrysis_carterae.AAC.1